MHQKLAELDRNWSFLKCGHSFRENWIFWFTPSRNFSMKIKSMWVTYESYQRILFPEGATTVGSEVFESPIWDTWTICNLDSIETNTDLSSETISDLELDPWPNSKQYVWTYEPLPTYGHLLPESHHSNVRKTLLWLFATLLCWL